ncbi:MAG: hypothetical protein E6K53_14350 [Gammaproteobacteria bacterium]|nr:MAG: hypothetical protein E6K53_14350 [Gammaproteobacteria bacterium]
MKVSIIRSMVAFVTNEWTSRSGTHCVVGEDRADLRRQRLKPFEIDRVAICDDLHVGGERKGR